MGGALLAELSDHYLLRAFMPPHCTAHYCDTSYGDTFGGLGTSQEVREEELDRRLIVGREEQDSPTQEEVDAAE